MRNQKGNVDVILPLFVMSFIFTVFFCMLFVGVKLSNETTSGIVYNTTHNRFISDATQFSIRANEATVTTDENKSTYCLPPNSPYKELVTRAAQDKRIKVVVEAKKHLTFRAPWTCVDNVTVREVK